MSLISRHINISAKIEVTNLIGDIAENNVTEYIVCE